MFCTRAQLKAHERNIIMVTLEKKLHETGIIPVVKIDNAEDAVPMANALLKGGISVVEVTFRTSAAASAIEKIATNVPEMLVLAGTVLSVEQAKLAADCGAKAIISPGTNEEVVKWCIMHHVPVFPGCATPTEVEYAMSLGLTTVKLFPAEVVGGVNMLKALYGPYRGIKFMPTGGLSTSNVSDYLSLPNVVACGGSWLCTDALLASKDYCTIENNAREASDIVKQFR